MTEALQMQAKAEASSTVHARLPGVDNKLARAGGLQEFVALQRKPLAVQPPLIQAKLKIGPPDDEYEREADRVADQVMSMPEPKVQREDEEEEEELQTKPLAAQIMPLVQKQAEPDEEEEEKVQAKSLDGLIQREEAAEEEEEKLQTKPLAGQISPLAQRQINELKLGGGQPLPESTRAFFDQRFDNDFGQVRVHIDTKAAESARALNAQAYTVGRNIIFGTRRYAPETSEGRMLLAHELAHVVQQSHHGASLQKLIRTPYPWLGVILPARGANIRSSPSSNDPANIVDSIPQGETVRVLSSSGYWLHVESRHRAPPLVGYIHHTLVDDATTRSMETSVGTPMVWRPSGPGSGTNFESWASAPTETPFPAVTATTVMNCWEAVLLAAYRSRAITWNWIHNLYVSTPTGDWVDAMSRGARHNYAIPGPNLPLHRGDLVFFNGLAHVALANGNGSEVITFWPPPNTPFMAGGTPDRVKVFTIENLVTWWERNMPPAPTVEFAAPAW